MPVFAANVLVIGVSTAIDGYAKDDKDLEWDMLGIDWGTSD
jgi:hypothetical protein